MLAGLLDRILGTPSAAARDRAFRDRVGAGETEGIAVPTQSKWIDWCMRLDRDLNVSPIEARIREMTASSGAIPPLLVIIPGPANGGHEVFMLRFSTQDLRDILGTERPYDPVFFLWPLSAQSVGDLDRALCRDLGGDTSTDPLADCLSRRSKSLCFRCLIDQAGWQKTGERLVRNWIEHVLRWPALPDRRVLICLLGFEMPPEGTPTHRAMSAFLDELGRWSPADGQVLVTPELEPVRPADLDAWLAWVDRHDTALSRHLRGARMDVFGIEQAPVPFVVAHHQLIACVQKVCRSLEPQYGRVP